MLTENVIENTFPESEQKQKVLNCSKCDYQATEEKYLENHLKVIHSGAKFQLQLENFQLDEEIRYFCSECDYQATQHSYLQNHMQSVHKQVLKAMKHRNMQCLECDYKATDQKYLKNHINLIHKKSTPSSDKNCIQTSGLQFQCNHCDYQATQQKFLENHIKLLHDNSGAKQEINLTKYVKPSQIECKECGKLVSNRKSLRKHIASVHEKVEHFCDQCDYFTHDKDNLRIHKKKSKHLTVNKLN